MQPAAHNPDDAPVATDAPETSPSSYPEKSAAIVSPVSPRPDLARQALSRMVLVLILASILIGVLLIVRSQPASAPTSPDVPRSAIEPSP